MKYYLKFLGIAMLFGVLKTVSFLNGALYYSVVRDGSVSLTYLVVSFGLGAPGFQTTSLLNMTLDMLPLFLFQLLFGTFLYHHFCTASVYFFSRQPKRIGWFLGQAKNLFISAFLYTLTMITTGICTTALLYPIRWDRASILLLAYYLIIYTLWLFGTSLTINLVAIKVGSDVSYGMVGGLQLMLVSSLLFWENAFSSEEVSQAIRSERLLQLNPISHLVLGWHSSFLSDVDGAIDQFQLDVTFASFQIDFDLNCSVLLFFLLSAVLLLVGCRIIQTQELIVNNMETGGA